MQSFWFPQVSMLFIEWCSKIMESNDFQLFDYIIQLQVCERKFRNIGLYSETSYSYTIPTS